MGYKIYFDGAIGLVPTLSIAHRNYLREFSDTYRKTLPRCDERLPDTLRNAVGLPFGEDGEYCCLRTSHGWAPPPASQPSNHCVWAPGSEGSTLVSADDPEYSAYAAEWMEYVMEHFITPWGYAGNGSVKWQGDDAYDKGVIIVKDNIVSVILGDVVADNNSKLESVDAIIDECRAYRKLLSAEMPADYKDWHQNSSAEWPLLASWALRQSKSEAAALAADLLVLHDAMARVWASAKRTGRWLAEDSDEECKKDYPGARWLPYTEEEQALWLREGVVSLLEAGLFRFCDAANSTLRKELSAEYGLDQEPT